MEMVKNYNFSKSLMIKYMEHNEFIENIRDNKRITLKHNHEIFEMVLRYIAFI